MESSHVCKIKEFIKKQNLDMILRRIWGSKEIGFLQYEWDHLVINATRPTTTTKMTTTRTTTAAAVKWSQVKYKC